MIRLKFVGKPLVECKMTFRKLCFTLSCYIAKVSAFAKEDSPGNYMQDCASKSNANVIYQKYGNHLIVLSGIMNDKSYTVETGFPDGLKACESQIGISAYLTRKIKKKK